MNTVKIAWVQGACATERTVRLAYKHSRCPMVAAIALCNTRASDRLALAIMHDGHATGEIIVALHGSAKGACTT